MKKSEEFKKVHLDNLFLDPNNYRLRTYPNYQPVNKGSETKTSIQQRTYNMLAGENNFEILDLIESFKSNGFLRVDHILVRRHDELEAKKKSEDEKTNYIIIEGNRRLATLKFLYEQYKKDFDIGNIDIKIFNDGVDVIVHEYPNETDYLILMGLRHVSGNKKWDVYNQAKLVFELSKKEYSNLEISKKIGIKPKSKVEELLRGYFAIQDFIKYVKEENLESFVNPHDKFMMFVELTNQINLRKWVGWDDNNFKITNEENKRRFFNWIQPIPTGEIEEDNYTPDDPYIKNHKQIRDLNELIFDEEFLTKMEEYGSFDSAKYENPTYKNKEFSEILKSMEKQFGTFTYGFISTLNDENRGILNRIKNIIEDFLKKSRNEN